MCGAKLENLIDIKSLSTEEISVIADRAKLRMALIPCPARESTLL